MNAAAVAGASRQVGSLLIIVGLVFVAVLSLTRNIGEKPSDVNTAASAEYRRLGVVDLGDSGEDGKSITDRSDGSRDGSGMQQQDTLSHEPARRQGGAQAQTVASMRAPSAPRLLLSSDSRLLWFHTGTYESSILHEGQVGGPESAMHACLHVHTCAPWGASGRP